ncbi:MAG: hypothetical protein ACOYBJ_03095 [Patescibacteria group bacterium]|jgi:large subunit ribosomal protein L1
MAERKKKVADDTAVIKEERAAERESKAYSQDEAADLDGQLVNEQEVVPSRFEHGADANDVVPAEVAAMHTDTLVAQEASGEAEVAAEPVQERAPKVKKQRSAKYQKAVADLNLDRSYALDEALSLAASRSYTSFDATVELHVRLAPQKKKEDQGMRGLLQLPHGTGKDVKVAVLTDELIDAIAKDKKTEYDILIAAPAMMPKVAKVAKILGPQGKMPSPKAGTVSDKPEEAAKAFQSGRIEYRADASGNIHLPIGKASWTPAQLAENARTVLTSIPRIQIAGVVVAATMGPGVRVNLGSL